MKNILMLIITLFIFSSISIAQELESKKNPSFIQISGGVSSPIGDFENLEKAKTGYLISLQGAIFINKWSGLGIVVTGGANEIENFYSNNTLFVVSDPYGVAFAGGGAFFEIPLSNFFKIKAKTTIGYLYAKSPDFNWSKTDYYYYDGYYYYDNSSGKIHSSEGGGLGFDFGAGIRIKLNKTIGLNLDFDYIFGNPELTIQNIKTELNYETVNGSFGVSFNI